MSAPRDGLGVAEGQVWDERRRAVRLLLRRPFPSAEQPDAQVFALIRKHQAELRRWFQEQLGYRLVIDHEQARLFKRRAPGALARPARTRSGSPFDRRRYSLLCLILAALERSEAQTILSVLAEDVKLLSAASDGVASLDLERSVERRAFVDAVRHLVQLGVLRETDGDDTAFVQGAGDVLYDVDSRRLARVLAAPVPPSLAAGPAEVQSETYPPTEDGKNLRLRHRLMRRLAEEPVLYFEELDDDERAYLTWQRGYLVRQLETWTGLAVEVRREGLAAIDDSGWLSDMAFPATSSVTHAALLFADELAQRLRREEVPAVPRGELVDLAHRLFARHRWAKAYRESPSGAEHLMDDALEFLASLRLVELRPEGALPLPAIARYRVAEVRVSEVAVS